MNVMALPTGSAVSANVTKRLVRMLWSRVSHSFYFSWVVLLLTGLGLGVRVSPNPTSPTPEVVEVVALTSLVAGMSQQDHPALFADPVMSADEGIRGSVTVTSGEFS